MAATFTQTVEIVGERGCGFPIAGGAYWQLLLGAGRPIDDLLFDPPMPMPVDETGRQIEVPARGVYPLRAPDGTLHLIDIVGEESYPDLHGYWFGEVHAHGVSRRLPAHPKGWSYSELGPRSLLLLAHRKALVSEADYAAYRDYYDGEGTWWCPQHNVDPMTGKPKAHPHPQTECVDFWSHDLVDPAPVSADGPKPFWPIMLVKQCGSAVYRGYPTPPGLKPTYRLGIFAHVPASRIAVYRDAEANTHEETLAQVGKADMDVTLVSGLRIVDDEYADTSEMFADDAESEE